MNTLHRFRKLAFAAALVASIASLAQGTAHAGTAGVAVADLGAMTVHAPRLSTMRIAGRLSTTRIADLGTLTVTARRSATIVVADAKTGAARPNSSSWN